MAVMVELELRGDNETIQTLAGIEERLDATRDVLRGINEEAFRNGFALRDFSNELVLSEQQAAQQREMMTKASFEKWIGHAAQASEWTRRAFTSSIGAIGRGIADELVDGTHDWRTALQGVLRQMIAVTAQMVIMRTLMTALSGGTAGWVGFLHGGGRVMHAGGPVRAHGGTWLREDETPIIAQRGEFLLRRRAVDAIGLERVERLNRGEPTGSGGPTTFNISVQMQGQANAARLAEELGPEIVAYLRRESERGVRFDRKN